MRMPLTQPTYVLLAQERGSTEMLVEPTGLLLRPATNPGTPRVVGSHQTQSCNRLGDAVNARSSGLRPKLDQPATTIANAR
jgi:hypothetical protein